MLPHVALNKLIQVEILTIAHDNPVPARLPRLANRRDLYLLKIVDFGPRAPVPIKVAVDITQP